MVHFLWRDHSNFVDMERCSQFRLRTFLNMGKNLTSIAALLIGVSVIALLVGRAQGTVSIIEAGTKGFGDLLKTVTLQ